jgi:ammonia channel protein AmtB
VIIGACADLFISPGVAILIGGIGGFITTFGYFWVQPTLLKYLKIHDTAGVNNVLKKKKKKKNLNFKKKI